MDTSRLVLIAIFVVVIGLMIWRGRGQPYQGGPSLADVSGPSLADVNSVGEANTKAVEENTRAIRELIAKLDERKS